MRDLVDTEEVERADGFINEVERAKTIPLCWEICGAADGDDKVGHLIMLKLIEIPYPLPGAPTVVVFFC
jgi:hypothetical protein